MGKINLIFDNPLVNTPPQNFFPINLANKCIGVYFLCLIFVTFVPKSNQKSRAVLKNAKV